MADSTTVSRIKKLLSEASIASVKAWLKFNELPFSAGTRTAIEKRVIKLVEGGKLTLAELETGLIGIEESSGKRIVLSKANPLPIDKKGVEDRLKGMGIKLATKRSLSPRLPNNPVLAYALFEGNELHMKWAETHEYPEVDYDTLKVIPRSVTKTVVLVADLVSGAVEIRYDRPEVFHPHSKSKGKSPKGAYFAHYEDLTEKILGVKPARVELYGALRSLITSDPSPIRLHVDEHTNQANNQVRFTARKGDVRSDKEYKAMYEEGGDEWVYDADAFYWKPDLSEGKLNREVFTHVEASESAIRFDADCHEAEVAYAISQIRKHQS
jgi:hypothetical protein